MDSDIPSILERLQLSISEKYNRVEELNLIREQKIARLQELENELGNEFNIAAINLNLVQSQNAAHELRV